MPNNKRNGSDLVTQNGNPRSKDKISPLKKVAAIHDLSCFGRCALTVIIPTVSAMGNQVVPIPTCLLSTHTGGFTDMYFEDHTDAVQQIGNHLSSIGLQFDCIYTGFLGSHEQIEIVEDFIDKFTDDKTLVLVDPVMGDDGVLYSTYTKELMEGMSQLCKKADVITPNLTEACFLTGTQYRNTSDMTEQELKDFALKLCQSLKKTEAKKAVVTGLRLGSDKLCVCGMDYFTDEFFLYAFPRVSKDYPGTGDLFASVLLGELLRNNSFEQGVRYAADFTSKVMEYSSRFNTPKREGVAFEAFLGELAEGQR
ncbi:MAG: pyridoxamine kinase [Clostridia bacterium]|nr:pyridoxamine kinase [Clostridia bacterium]